MNVKKNLAVAVGKLTKKGALHMGVSSVNSACFGWYHQPKVPETMMKYKK